MRGLAHVGAIVIAGVALCASDADAATLTVTTTNDITVPGDGQCSLREAIAAVNSPGTQTDCGKADATANTIVLAPDSTYLLSIPAVLPSDDQTNGDLDVTSTAPLTIQGGGDGTGGTTISGARAADRVMHVLAGANVTIENLTVSDGSAPNGADQPQGTAPEGPSVGGTGFSGGGIFNGGTLQLENATVTDNRAGNGGAGGQGANGWGTFPDSGVLIGDGAPGGVAGAGGGIYNIGTLHLTDVTVSSNFAGNGGAGGAGGSGVIGVSGFMGNPGGQGGTGGGAGCCGDGGGLANVGGTVTIQASTFTGNHAGAGGIGGAGGVGGSGNGTGPGGDGGTGAGGSSGGAIASSGGSVAVLDSTLTGDTTGNGGLGGSAGPGSTVDEGTGSGGNAGNGSAGGAVYGHAGAAIQLTNVTANGNQLGSPGAPGSGQTSGSAGAPSFGGGVYVNGTPGAAIRNTVLASNELGNCAGSAPTDLGHNLSFGDAVASCPAGFTTGDPLLGPLQDNGGPTETEDLKLGSAATDQVPATGAGCPQTDERGVARPQGAACDIGAFELAAPTVSTGAVTAVTTTGAELNGSVTPNQSSAQVHFESGTTIAFGSVTATVTVTGSSPTAVSASLAGLQPHTTYDFRLVATSSDGTSESGLETFTTDSAPPPAKPPQISKLKLKPSKLEHKGKGGKITYVDSEAAKTVFVVLRCVKPSKHAHECKRLTRVGSFSHRDKAGQNKAQLHSKLGRHSLAPGRYELEATPNAGGLTGKAIEVGFTIV